MTVSFVVLCASGSIVFGLLFGRLFAWWQEVKDEEQAMANANVRARFDSQRFDDQLVDPFLVAKQMGIDDPLAEKAVIVLNGRVIYDWQKAES